MVQDFRHATFAVGKHAMTMIQIVVNFHVADCGKTVEPGIGDRFYVLAKSSRFHTLNQLVALPVHFGWPFKAGDDDDIASPLGLGDFETAFCFRQAEQIGSGSNCCDEILAG